MNQRIRSIIALILVSSVGLVTRPARAAGELYLLFTCHLDDPKMIGEARPGTVELYADLTRDPKTLHSTAPKAGVFTVDVLRQGKQLVKMAIPAVIHSIPVLETAPLTRAPGKLVVDVDAPYSAGTRHPVRFEVETDAQGNPASAYETDLKNGAKMYFACQWAPMVR